jgi:hypothetical protein
MNARDDNEPRFERDGYAIHRGAFDIRTIFGLRAEADLLRRRAEGLSETMWAGPVRWLIVPGQDGRPVLRGLQFPYRISAAYDDIRTHPTIQRILSPLIGSNVASVLATLFWKPAGTAETVIAYHQDSTFRKPVEKFRNLATSYVQLGVALDPHGPDNGGMRFVVGSHKEGDRQTQRTTSTMHEAPTDHELGRLGFRADQVRDIELDSGDVVMWHPHLFHGSRSNRSLRNDRLFYVIGYMKRADTDEGEPAFIDGKPCICAHQ